MPYTKRRLAKHFDGRRPAHLGWCFAPASGLRSHLKDVKAWCEATRTLRLGAKPQRSHSTNSFAIQSYLLIHSNFTNFFGGKPGAVHL